jgi:hypothetical protein
MVYIVKGFDDKRGKPGDSVHTVLSDGLLAKHGAELHRFTNGEGVEYSAIYRGDFEEMSCVRRDEERMIAAYKRRLFEDISGGAKWVYPF